MCTIAYFLRKISNQLCTVTVDMSTVIHTLIHRVSIIERHVESLTKICILLA